MPIGNHKTTLQGPVEQTVRKGLCILKCHDSYYCHTQFKEKNNSCSIAFQYIVFSVMMIGNSPV